MSNLLISRISLYIRRCRRLRPLFQAAVIIFAVVLSVSFFGSTNYQVQGVSVKVYVGPSLDGRSYLKLPPLGDLSADTHRGPVDFNMELTGIHPDILEGFSQASSQQEWMGNLQSEVRKHLVLFFLKQALIGGAGAALIYLIVFRPGWKGTLAAFLAGFVLAALVLGYSAATYDTEAFKQPQYRGMVAAGPEVLLLADQLYDKFQNFKGTTNEVVRSVNTLFSNIEGLDMLDKPGEGEVQILIVSDISNNPVGVELTKTLANSFKVDMVIDAGDLTDFGSLVEAQAFSQIGSLGVPYLFAPGNHDSPEVTAFLRGLANVTILEGQKVVTKGLSVLGVPDPWSFGSTVNGTSQMEIREALEEQANTLKALLEKEKDVDIAVIHNPTMAESVEGLAPVIISGHTHRLSVRKTGGSIYLNPGTTGASGFRGLQAEEMSYSALILHLSSEKKEQAVVDIIEYDPLSSSITTQRRLLK